MWFVVGPGLRWSGEGALQHSKVGWLPYNSHLTKSYSRADDNGCPPLEDEEERWCSLYLCSRLLGLIILILCKVKVTHTFPFIVLTGDNNRLATNIIVHCPFYILFMILCRHWDPCAPVSSLQLWLPCPAKPFAEQPSPISTTRKWICSNSSYTAPPTNYKTTSCHEIGTF